jgi:hypothetical protein
MALAVRVGMSQAMVAPRQGRAADETRYYQANASVYDSTLATFYDLTTFPLLWLRRRVARLAGVRAGMRVLDFGVAKLLADTVAGLGEANLTSIGFSIFGSALYIAPEAVTGQPVDARLDLYSTGAMLFEMLAGVPPFNDEDPSVLLRKHAFEPAPTLQQIAPAKKFPPELESLVAQALAKQPDERFRWAADMIAAVDAALRTFEAPVRPITAPAAVVATPSVDARRATTVAVRGQSWRKLAIGAGVVAAGIGVLAFVLMRGGDTSAARSPRAAATRDASPAAKRRSREQRDREDLVEPRLARRFEERRLSSRIHTLSQDLDVDRSFPLESARARRGDFVSADRLCIAM